MKNYQEFIDSDEPKSIMDKILAVHNIIDTGSMSQHRDLTDNVMQRITLFPEDLARLQAKLDEYKAAVKPELLRRGVVAFFRDTKWENPEAEHTIEYEHEGRAMTTVTSLRAIHTNIKAYLTAKVLEAALDPSPPLPGEGRAESGWAIK